MAARYWRRLLCGREVHEEPAMWQQDIGGGCYVATAYKRRVHEEAAMWQQGIGVGYRGRLP